MKKRIAKKIIRFYIEFPQRHSKRQYKHAFDTQIKIENRLRKKHSDEINFLRNHTPLFRKQALVPKLIKKLSAFNLF